LLTPEAIRRESLHKEGIVHATPFFPAEKKSKGSKLDLPARKSAPTDPNLER